MQRSGGIDAGARTQNACKCPKFITMLSSNDLGLPSLTGDGSLPCAECGCNPVPPRSSGLDNALAEGLVPYEPCAVARSFEARRNDVACMWQQRSPESLTHVDGDGVW